RKPHLEDVLDTIRRKSDDRIAVRLISPERIRRMFPGSVRNKDDLASRVAAHFPDLAWKLPPPRKFPRREHYRMSIFDAAALALAYYGPRANEGSIPSCTLIITNSSGGLSCRSLFRRVEIRLVRF